MKILVEQTHPAQVHFFRNAIALWRARGHEVLVASREKECLTELLDAAGIDHRRLSRQGRGLLGLGRELLGRDLRMLALVRRFGPDVLVGRFCISASRIGWLTGRPVVVFEDTEHAALQQRITLPFASVICSTTSYGKDWGRRQIRYDGIDHMAYTHPSYFTPDPAVLATLGLGPDEPYSVLRLVSWRAAHDVGHRGLRETDLDALIALLGAHGRVLISSEAQLPAKWASLRIAAAASEMLNILAFARLSVGEGGSIASESACLGAPAVFVSPLRVGYLLELESRYGLARNVDTGSQALAAAAELLQQPPEEYQRRRQRLLAEKVDVTQFVADLVERVGRREPVL